MKLVKLLIITSILGIFEPAIASKNIFENNLKISKQSSKKWVGKWIAEGNGKSCALLISPDGSWYFMNNYSGKDAEGFYTIEGNKLPLSRELDARERMVFTGKTSILYFECRSLTNSIEITPRYNYAGILSGGTLTLRKQ